MAFFGNLFGHRAQKPTAMPTFSPSAKGPFVFPGLDENLQPIRSEAVKIEPKLPDYASYSDEQLARCFLPENWTAKSCDNDHRQALLQEASNRFAAAHGLPPTRVRLNSNLAEADMGAYSPSSRSIELNPNPKYLDNPFEALDSVVHETQHYVDDMNVRRRTGDTPENLAVYACEQSSAGYGDPPDSKAERNAAWQDAYNYYQMQSLEAHANNAGFAAVASHHELFKNCPEYSDYLARRDRYFSNLKDNLAADPEKWKGMEQDHIQKANGQTQATRELATEEVKRGTDAQQKAALNADSVKLLQHDCARQKQQAAAQATRNSAAVQQNGNHIPGQDTTATKTTHPLSDERSRHEAFVASLRQGLGQNNGQNPGQKAGQNSGQSAAASDGAPDPPERERTRPEQGRPREEDDDRMRRAAPLDEDTRDTGRSEEQAPRTEKPAPRQGEAQPGQSPETQGQTPAPEENAPQQGEAQPGQSPEAEGQTPAPEENAPDNGEERNPGKQQTMDGETSDGGQQNTTAETQTAPVGESGEAAAQAHATEPEEESDAPAPAQETAAPAPEEEPAQAPAAEESPREEADRPEAGEQAPHTEDDAPDRGEPTGPDREEPEAAPAETGGIGEGPDRDDHGPNNGPQQGTDEEAEGIREPEAAREAAPAEAQDGIQDSPESEAPHGEEQRDGIQDAPDLSRENTPEDDGIRDSGEETAPDPSREEQAEGISGPDTAPAESAGEEQSLGQ